MKALTITPGVPNSALVREVPDPPASDGSILVRAFELGICGTDFELISGDYGWAPPGDEHLVLGHESFGEVVDAPADGDLKKGDFVVGIVRHPDPVPCMACAAGEWDMCRNGRYTERGIKERNGFGAEFWRTEPAFAVKIDPAIRTVGVLTEPASVLAKAWDHIRRIGERARWAPRTVLITGAGPIGLLAALMGMQRQLEVHVLDRVVDGPKPKLVEALGGKYYTGEVKDVGFKPDVIIECTGVPSVIVQALSQLNNDGILCLAGVSTHGQTEPVDVGTVNRNMVLDNTVMFGTVNANRSHWEMAVNSLKQADLTWLSGIISRREPLSNWQAALTRHPNDIKVVIDLAAA